MANYFQLDSGVLQQYGRPPTPEVTKDPFGSAVAGFQVGQSIANKANINRRADERLAMDKEAVVTEQERYEVEQERADAEIALEAEKEITRKEELDREQDRLEKAAVIAEAATKQQIQESKARMATQRVQLEVAKEALDTTRGQKDAEAAINAVEAELANDPTFAAMSTNEKAIARYQKVFSSPDLKDMPRDLVKGIADDAMEANPNGGVAARQERALNAITALDMGADDIALSEMKASLAPKDAELLLSVRKEAPNTEDPEGTMGYLVSTYDDGTIEGREVRKPISPIAAGNEDWANRHTQSINFAMSANKRKEDDKRRAFKVDYENYKRNIESLGEATKRSAAPLTDPEYLKHGGWLQANKGDAYNKLDADNRKALTEGVGSMANYLVEVRKGSSYDVIMYEAYNTYDTYNELSKLDDKAGVNYLKDFFGVSYGKDVQSPDTSPAAVTDDYVNPDVSSGRVGGTKDAGGRKLSRAKYGETQAKEAFNQAILYLGARATKEEVDEWLKMNDPQAFKYMNK